MLNTDLNPTEHNRATTADSNFIAKNECYVTQDVTPNVVHILRAAQMSNKTETSAARSPFVSSQRLRKTPRKSKRFAFRADDSIQDIIEARMKTTGLSESETIRQLIEDSTQAPRILIQAKAPPEHLETFISSLKSWHYDFLKVWTRINAPIPFDSADPDLISHCKEWREATTRLLREIPHLLEAANCAQRQLTTLTPERIKMLRENYEEAITRKDQLAGILPGAKTLMEKAIYEFSISTLDIITDAIEDLGIVSKK